MISKYQNHTLQTNSWQHEEKPHSTRGHKTLGRQFK